MSSDSDAAISDKVSQFLTNENTTLEDRLALTAFLEARPKYSKPTSYLSDIEERLQILQTMSQKLENSDWKFNCTAALWSALMVVPLERLRAFRDQDFDFLMGMLRAAARELPLLLKVFLAKNPSRDELIRADAPTRKRRRESTSEASLGSSLTDTRSLAGSYRSKTEPQKCEQRDICCVVTGAADPDICHIFPFSATKNPDQTSSSMDAFHSLWGKALSQRYKSLLIGDHNIIDTAANMVSLEPLLHRWWSKALIGFEPVERIEMGIRLRFRWLPRTKLAMGNTVPLDLNPSESRQPKSDSKGYVGISHFRTHRPIIDGTVIDITAHDESAIPSWDLFSLQWDLIRMASLCGAAEASDDDDWESDDEDYDEAGLGSRSPSNVARTTAYPGLPATPLTTIQPLQSLPVQSRESSPIKAPQPRESSPLKPRDGRVDENIRQ